MRAKVTVEEFTSTESLDRLGPRELPARQRVNDLLDSGAGWPACVLGLTLLAVVVRVLIVAHTRGGEDLRMYTYFSRLPLRGINPFAAPAAGLFPPIDSNNPPIEVAVFSGLLKLMNSPTALRGLFVAADALTLLTIGLAIRRTRRWRLGMLLFIGFNPFLLIGFTAFAEDKTLLFLGVLCWLVALEAGREAWTWVSASALTVFKFLGAFALPALALHSWRRSGRQAAIPICAYVIVFMAANLPWYPESLHAFARRNVRLGVNPPIHASPLLILSRLHVYAPIEAKLGLVISILVVLGLYAARRIEIREAVVFSLFGGYSFLPENAFDRLLLITLPLLLLLEISWRRWLIIWALTTTQAAAAYVATRGVPHELHLIAPLLHDVFAREATVRHVIWMNLFPAAVLFLYTFDRRRGRAPIKSIPGAA